MSATIMRKPKALLLHSDATVLRLLGTALEARGFDVRAATDGEAGLALLLDELLELDVLVTDVDLPGRDGWSLLRLIRGPGGERDLAVFVLADGAKPVRDALLALGASGVIDRACGHAAAAEAIVSFAGPSAPAPARTAAEAPALRGALLVARTALSMVPRLSSAAA